MNKFEIGDQPCQNLVPKFDGNSYGYGPNVHECPECGGQRQFCLTCHRDHHAGGWDTCNVVPHNSSGTDITTMKTRQQVIDIIKQSQGDRCCDYLETMKARDREISFRESKKPRDERSVNVCVENLLIAAIWESSSQNDPELFLRAILDNIDEAHDQLAKAIIALRDFKKV